MITTGATSTKRAISEKNNIPRTGSTMARTRDQISQSVAAETKEKLNAYLIMKKMRCI